MRKPFFSIIVVSLNAGKELKYTLNSILDQTYDDYEIILKDGQSKDGSTEGLSQDEFLKNHPAIRFYCKKDKGIYDAMNQAIDYIAGEYVIFLNCGDYFYDQRVLEKTAKKIIDHVEQGVEGRENRPFIFYGNQWNRKQKAEVISSPQITNFTLYRNVPCHQVCFYHYSLFLERGYDLKYKVRADYEHFLFSVIKKEASCYFLDETIASYEGGGYSETKENKKISAREHKEITKKYLGGRQCFVYRLILLCTLSPLRSKIAENPKLSGGYHQLKSLIYRRKK